MTRILLAPQDALTVFGRDRGTGTALPTTDRRRGDVYSHTGLGCLMAYNGTVWRQVHVAEVADAAARTTMSTSYAGAMHPGFRARQANTGVTFEWTGSAWHPAVPLLGAIGSTVNSASLTAAGTAAFPFDPLPATVQPGMRLACRLSIGWWNNNAAATAFSLSTVTAVGGTASLVESGSFIVWAGGAYTGIRSFLFDVTAPGAVITATMAGGGGSFPTVTIGPLRIDYTTGYAA